MTAPTSRRIFLVRHGRTTWNNERRFQGHADPPLDVIGHAQADAMAAALGSAAPMAVVCSDSLRALQTAQAVAAHADVGVSTDPRLRERCLGRWETRTFDEVARQFPDEFERWMSGVDAGRVGGENLAQVTGRVLAAVDELPDDAVTVVVTHSVPALVITAALTGIDSALTSLTPLGNCRWTELAATTGAGTSMTWQLRAHNAGVGVDNAGGLFERRL